MKAEIEIRVRPVIVHEAAELTELTDTIRTLSYAADLILENSDRSSRQEAFDHALRIVGTLKRKSAKLAKLLGKMNL